MNLTGKLSTSIEIFCYVCTVITVYSFLDPMFKGTYHGKQAHRGKSVVAMLEDFFGIFHFI